MKALRLTPRDLVLAVSALVVALALVLVRQTPPAPLPIDAPSDRFSAGRAMAIVDELVGNGVPHPAGSEANAKVREGILSRLRSLGYEPETQEQFVCGEFGACAPVVNVIAQRAGREEGPAVALVAHYDSVPAGPGAADDGSGVAILLETARLLSQQPPSKNAIVFLFTDGEEAGLLGARAFVERHPLSHDIGAVVNVEARGTRGPSLLFETSGDDAWLIDLFARHAPHPVTSSLFSAVYERMPNDSDLSVFARHGIPGVNFAFLGGVPHYHTPLDDIAHLSLASLQDHGDHALAMTRALAEADLTNPPSGRAVYFDLLSLGLIRYPASLSSPLAWLAVFAVGALLLGVLSRRQGTIGEAVRGFVTFLLSPAIACATSLGLGHSLALFGVTRNWVAYPLPLVVTFVAVGLLTVTLSASLTRHDSPLGTYSGMWLGWALLGLLVSSLLPGASYLVLLPTLAAALAGAVVQVPRIPRGLCVALLLAPSLLAALLWFPILAILYDAVGLQAMPVLAGGVALIAGSALPFASALGSRRKRGLVGFPALVTVLGAAVTGMLPVSSPDIPERLSLTLHHDADTGASQWLASPESGSLPEPMRRIFGSQRTSALPWSAARAFTAPAEVSPLSGPEVTVLTHSTAAGIRHVKMRVSSDRPASTVTLAFPPDAEIRQVTIEGELAAHRVEAGWKTVQVRGVPARGVEVEVKALGPHPVKATVVNRASGLPPEGRPLVESRPKHAVPSQEGDTTLVSRRFDL